MTENGIKLLAALISFRTIRMTCKLAQIHRNILSFKINKNFIFVVCF